MESWLHRDLVVGCRITVNQLNFAAIKFRGSPNFPILGIFRAIKFRVLVSQDLFLAKTLLHKNAWELPKWSDFKNSNCS